ncbi:MAG: ABC transporter permease [Sarcina sp.]
MYVNLTLKNAKKSVKDYLIYFITIMLCSSLFYAFTSLSSSEYEFITESTLNFEYLQMMLKHSTYLITLALTILVFYVNSYMVKRRYKEFGTYILLGMEQKTVALMFFMEALVIGVLAIVCGVLLGTIFSQLLTISILVSAEQEVLFNFRFYTDAAIQTVIFFLIMFGIIGLFNIIALNKVKLIDFMNQDKKTDCRFKKKGIFYVVLFSIAIICYLTSLKSFMTFIDFFDNNVAYNLMKALLVGGVSFIVGTYFMFYSISYIIVVVKERFIGFKYKGTNLVLLGGLSAKIKSSPGIMATISLTLLFGMISFIGSLMMAQWSSGYLDYRLPFDIAISNEIIVDNDKYSKFNMDYDAYKKELSKDVYKGKDFIEFSSYFVEDNSEHEKQIAIKLTDFNKIRKMLGYEEVSLKDNEYILQVEKTMRDEILDEYIKETANIKIDNQKLILRDDGIFKDSIGECFYDFSKFPLIYVVNDKYLDNKDVVFYNFVADLDDKIPFEDGVELAGKLDKIFEESNGEIIEKVEGRVYPYARIKIVEKNTILNATLGMRILGMYVGIVLFMISLTILGLKQLVDSIENKDRFIVLQKLGVEEKDINKIILKQISIYFGVALLIAVTGFILFLAGYLNIYKEQVEVYIGNEAFILNIIVSFIIMFMLYSGYFMITYQSFKRNIWK